MNSGEELFKRKENMKTNLENGAENGLFWLSFSIKKYTDILHLYTALLLYGLLRCNRLF